MSNVTGKNYPWTVLILLVHELSFENPGHLIKFSYKMRKIIPRDRIQILSAFSATPKGTEVQQGEGRGVGEAGELETSFKVFNCKR